MAGWKSRWYASKQEFAELLVEDQKIRNFVANRKDRFGKPKTHPALAVEKDNKIIFARLMRELNLDIEPPGNTGRPPGLYK